MSMASGPQPAQLRHANETIHRARTMLGAMIESSTSSSSHRERLASSPAVLAARMSHVHEAAEELGDLVDGQVDTDTSDDEAATSESVDDVALALALLLQAQETASRADDGGAFLSSSAITRVLDGLVKAIGSSPVAAAPLSSREVESQMERLFVSHANVFDETVQNFIIQNFIQETDYAKAFRSAMRRTSLVKRCLKAMYPSDRPPAVAPLHASYQPASPAKALWSHTLSATAVLPPDTLEACPQIRDPAAVTRIRELLTTLSSWEFDLFALADAAPGHALAVVGHELLTRYDLCGHFRTTKARQLEFLKQVQSKYLPHPYHNAEHAADVAQSLHHFLEAGQLGATMNPRSKCAAVLAAIVHDVGHTSFSNNFHIAANDELAVQYVYRSPLEHMHCAVAFRLIKSPACDILRGLSRLEQMEVRTLVTDMVLATDNSVHAMYLAKLEALVRRRDDASDGACSASAAAGWTLATQPDDERLVLQMALHAADVSNPAKPLRQCRQWAERIRLEFFEQGDKERELELPVSIGYDREHPIPLEKMQAGFILGIVRPLFTAFCQLPGARLDHCLAQLDENLASWQSEIARNQPQ